MFRLDAKTKKILQADHISTCAYIYNDGVVVKHEQEFHTKGYDFKKEFIDIYPCEIPIHYRHRKDLSTWDSEGYAFKGRIVVHSPTMLIHGIARIEIYEGNSSEKMKARGMTCDTVTLTTLEGAKFQEHIYPFISSCYTIQDDAHKSVEDWKKAERDQVITVHELKAA